MRGRATLAILGGVLALALAPAAHAAPRWGPERAIFAPQRGFGVGIDMVVRPNGDALAFDGGSDFGPLYMVGAHDRGEFRARRTFPGPFPFIGAIADAPGPMVAMFIDDDEDPQGFYVRTLDARGDLGPRQTIDPFRDKLLDSLLTATSPRGDVFLVWGTSSAFCACLSRLYVRVRAAGDDEFGPAQVLTPANRAAYDPQLAFDSHGDALLAWGQYDDVSRGRVAYARRPADGAAFGPRRLLPRGGTHGTVDWLDLAGNGAGRVVAVWASRSEPERDMRAAIGTVSGGLGSVELVGKGRSGRPHVAVEPGGEAVATWADPRPSYAVAPPGAGFGAKRVLERGRSTPPAVAADGAGTFTLAWRRFRDGALRAARRRVGASATRVVELVRAHVWRSALEVTAAHETLISWILLASKEQERLRGGAVALARPQRRFGRPLDLHVGDSGTAYPNSRVHIATDAEGGALVWWHHHDGDGDSWFGRFLYPP
jgi:hypothetical protein